MSNLIYMPKPEDLGAVYEQVRDVSEEKLKTVLKDLAGRVLEHSDEIKKLFEGVEDYEQDEDIQDDDCQEEQQEDC